MGLKRPVRANADKPHRCPYCHCIPEKMWQHGKAKRMAIYSCSRCNIFWTKMIATMTNRWHLNPNKEETA